MIAGFLFFSITLVIKSAYSGEHSTLLGFALAFTIVLGPTMLSHKKKTLSLD